MSGTVDDEDALYVELAQKTARTVRDWQDILSLPPDARAEVIADWNALGDMSWTKSPSTLDRVETILNILVSIASPVTTIVGGLTGIGTLITTLKAI